MASTPVGKKPAPPKKSTKPAVPPKGAGNSARQPELFVAPFQAVIAENAGRIKALVAEDL